MESTFLNKAAFAVLLCVAVAWGAGMVGRTVVPDASPRKPVFSIPGLEKVLIRPYMQHADPQRGAALVGAVCSNCHAINEHAQESVGPALTNVAGRFIASLAGFHYSSALADLAKERWSDQNLSDWLAAPSRFAPGTRMSLMGIPQAEQRADIIAFLHTLTTPTSEKK